MGIQSFNLEYSAWLILVAVILGLAFAGIMYSAKAPWSKQMNFFLAALRTILVAAIVVLLLGPVLNSIINDEENPIVVFAIDNSKSIGYVEDSSVLTEMQNQIGVYEDRLTAAGWTPEVYTFSGPVSDGNWTYNQEKSNLSQLLKQVSQDHEGQNLASIILISDGIFNQGLAPHLLPVSQAVSTFGIGDTTQLLDLGITDVRYNKIAYDGNKFPIEVDIKNIGLSSQGTNLSIFNKGRVIASKRMVFSEDKPFMTERFEVEATETGMQSYRVVLDIHPDEFTDQNNRQTIFIDIIDGKEKILIIPGIVHPDIKAIKQAIEINEHFEVSIAEGGERPEDYDLLIFYQYPAFRNAVDYSALLNNARVAKLYILGLNSDINGLARQGIFSGRLLNRQGDLVTGSVEEGFRGFEFSESLVEWISNNPPLSVPYASVSLGADDQVIIHQQVGPVVTEKPLLFYRNQDPKTGFLLGENLWRWRLDEFRSNGNHQNFDELIGKTVQFLSSKPDNRQFKVYPSKETFDLGEEVILNIEMYNELFEPVYGEGVTLNLTKSGEGQRQQFTLTTALGNQQFRLDALSEGLYDYAATTTINNQSISVSGQFVIENINLEALDLTADHRTLRLLSEKTGGAFYSGDNMEQFVRNLEDERAPSIIHSRQKESSLISFLWVFLLLLSLASTEWFLRKFYGSY